MSRVSKSTVEFTLLDDMTLRKFIARVKTPEVADQLRLTMEKHKSA